MLRALIQLAPRTSDTSESSGAGAGLRSLAEFPDAGDTAWVIDRGADGVVRARPVEVDESDDPLKSRYGFVFRKPSGPRGAQLGLVLKRSFNAQKEPVPGATILALTLNELAESAKGDGDGAETIRYALSLLGEGDGEARAARYIALRDVIDAKQGTVFVSLGPPPGREPSYARFYQNRVNALYDIDESSPVRACDVCGRTAPVSDKALSAAKINFFNRDNHGVYPSFDESRAGDRFALCARCAGAITTTYIDQKDALRVEVAGETALLLPYIQTPHPSPEASRDARDVLAKARAGTGTAVVEGDLLDALANERSLACFHLVWAKAGDKLDEVSGFITDVPTTRLAELSALNQRANGWKGTVFPVHRVRDFDLRLSIVGELLRRPGGARVRKVNEGKRLAALRRGVARAVYHRAPIDPATLYAELRAILADHLVDPSTAASFLAWGLTHEGAPKKAKGKAKDEVPMTAAGRARHFALLLHYLRELKVIEPMSDEAVFRPACERLKQYFDAPSGIDSDAKAFAFLTGVVFGRLVSIQAARNVNVQSNALVWLRRATLSGADLPGLIVKIRQKFQEYRSEGSALLREVLHDLSVLGLRLGTKIPLDTDTTMYFLFLGQSLSGDVFAKEEGDDGKDSDK